MKTFGKLIIGAVAAAVLLAAGPAAAQQKLKWAHVYETTEPFHTWSVWAAGEIEKRTNGRYHIDVFPASTLGKESDINQGLTLGTVDMIISGLSFAARTHARASASATTRTLPRRRPPDQVCEERRVQGARRPSTARRPASRSRR